MKPHHHPLLSDSEQALLDGVSVRLIDHTERARYDQWLVAEHYLHSATLVGEQLRYVAAYDGQWVALLTWNAAAFNLKDRETWIGWTPQQKRRRLSLVVNNSRFLILLPPGQAPNLASRVLKLCLARLSADWQAAYAHPVLVAESFVDSQLFRGTCYKASGWTLLGQTQGYARSRQDYYVAHERPKQLWVRELSPVARTILRGRNLPAALQPVEAAHPPVCEASTADLERMVRFFTTLPDWRSQQGLYRVASLVTVVVCAALCGAHRGQRDLAVFVADMTPAQWAALGFVRRGKRGARRWCVPKETTFFRLLSQLDARALERALLDWQEHVLGARPLDDQLVAVDGKELLHSQGVEIVSAYAVKSGRWLGSELVAAGSNEIPAAQELLRRAPLAGALVVADALHTQAETARIIMQEGGGDYLFTVKANQPTVAASVQQLHDGVRHAFSPSAAAGDGANRRTQSRAAGSAGAGRI
jgi:hypothetical protein